MTATSDPLHGITQAEKTDDANHGKLPLRTRTTQRHLPTLQQCRYPSPENTIKQTPLTRKDHPTLRPPPPDVTDQTEGGVPGGLADGSVLLSVTPRSAEPEEPFEHVGYSAHAKRHRSYGIVGRSVPRDTELLVIPSRTRRIQALFQCCLRHTYEVILYLIGKGGNPLHAEYSRISQQGRGCSKLLSGPDSYGG